MKILLAEDNSDFREILSSYLSTHYQVIEAENGIQALNIALKQSPDVIISDVMMPGKTGFELCSELKNNIETKMIPVILLTAKTSDKDIAEGYLSGADSFITKPVSLPVLHSRITSLLMKKVNLEPVPDEPLQEVDVKGKLSNEQFIRLLKKVISVNLSDSEFQVSDMHVQFGMSSSNFYRKVKELTKMAPVEYVKIFRLNKAASMLKKADLSIAEVAYGTGFSDQSYFGVCFKKQFGLTPTTYIRKAKASLMP
jgi:DNA-binding response OmpR family regulator